MANLPIHLRYYEKLRRLDRAGAVDLVREYLDGPGGVEGLFVDVFMPALVHTGQEWAGDRISVAHEHYITEVTRDLIRRHGPTLHAEPSAGRVAVACCAPGERHTIGLQMVCDILRGEGLDVHALGEGAPAEAVRDFAEEVGADVLCLSCALPTHLPDAADLIALCRAARPGLVVLVGGAAFGNDPARALALGADHYAADAREVRRIAPQLRAAAV